MRSSSWSRLAVALTLELASGCQPYVVVEAPRQARVESPSANHSDKLAVHRRGPQGLAGCGRMAPGGGEELEWVLARAEEFDGCEHPDFLDCRSFERMTEALAGHSKDDPDVAKTLVVMLSSELASVRYAAAQLLSETCWHYDEVLINYVFTRLAIERDPIVAERLAAELIRSKVDLYLDERRRYLMTRVLIETTVDAVYMRLGPGVPDFLADARVMRAVASQARVARHRRDALERLQRITGPDPKPCVRASERVLAAVEHDAEASERALLERVIDAHAPVCAQVYAKLFERARELAEIDRLAPEVYALLVALNAWTKGSYQVEVEGVSKRALRSFRHPELRAHAAAELERGRLGAAP